MGATFGKLKKELDIYFLKKDQDPAVFQIGRFIIRIRHCDEGKFITYKEITKTRGAWKEYETKIENPEEMTKILENLHLVEFWRIEKERIPGKLSKFNFNLDKVKGLGNFLEIELISENGEKAQKEIKELFKKLSISENQLERKGYVEIWQDIHGGGIKIDEQK